MGVEATATALTQRAPRGHRVHRENRFTAEDRLRTDCSGAASAEDRELIAIFAAAYTEVPVQTDAMSFHHALESLWRAIDYANKYIVVTAPFTVAKDPAQHDRVGAILHNLLEALHATALLLQWFLPETSARILQLLGHQPATRLPAALDWGTHFPPGAQTLPSVAMFPRIETEGHAVRGAPKAEARIQ